MNNVSRLNAAIKLLFLVGEMLFLVVSLLCFVGAGLVASKQIPLFLFPVAQTTAAIVLAISGAALACSCYGCCAAVRQTKRRGCFFARGRIMLCAHQLLLITILFFGIVNLRYLQNQGLRIDAIIEDVASFPEYNNFERHVSSYVNQLYFAESFQDSAAADWLMKLVEDKCPKLLSHCADQSEVKDEYCDFSTKLCCPDERLCLDSGLKTACAYDMCRPQLLSYLYGLVRPATIFVQVVLMVTLLMLILSCLLICFNKRDEIEVELLKTGNLAEEDIVAIRERRAKMKPSNNKVRRRTIEFGSRKRVTMTTVSPAELA